MFFLTFAPFFSKCNHIAKDPDHVVKVLQNLVFYHLSYISVDLICLACLVLKIPMMDSVDILNLGTP